MSAHLAGARRTGRVGGTSGRGRPHCQVFNEVERSGVVAVRRGQVVRVRVPRYVAEVYAPSLGGCGQELLQGTCTWGRATGVAVGALGCYAVWHRVNGEGSHRALDVMGDDGAEACQPCCVAFAMVHPDRILQRPFEAQLSGQLVHGAFVGGYGDCARPSANAWEHAASVLYRASSAGCLEGGAVGRRGLV